MLLLVNLQHATLLWPSEMKHTFSAPFIYRDFNSVVTKYNAISSSLKLSAASPALALLPLTYGI